MKKGGNALEDVVASSGWTQAQKFSKLDWAGPSIFGTILPAQITACSVFPARLNFWASHKRKGLESETISPGNCSVSLWPTTPVGSAMTLMQKTYVAKPNELPQKWFHVDATEQVLGRLASDIAMILMGKHRPTYTPHVDTGDFVVVTHADKVVMTGKKMEHRHYAWYNGYTGQKMESYKARFERKPEDLIIAAVRRMLPKNKLGRHMLDKLKVYAGAEHPHAAQTPESIELGKKAS